MIVPVLLLVVPPLVTGQELREIRERRERIYRAQLMTAAALAVLACAVAAPFLDDVAAMALGAPLVVLLYLFLALPLERWRERAGRSKMEA